MAVYKGNIHPFCIDLAAATQGIEIETERFYGPPKTNMPVGGKQKKAHTVSNNSVSQMCGTLEVMSLWATFDGDCVTFGVMSLALANFLDRHRLGIATGGRYWLFAGVQLLRVALDVSPVSSASDALVLFVLFVGLCLFAFVVLFFVFAMGVRAFNFI